MPVRSAGLARRRPVRLAGRGVARRGCVGWRDRHRARRKDPVAPAPRIRAPADAHMPTADVSARVGRGPLRAGDTRCKSGREHRGHDRYRQSHCDSHAAQRRLLAPDREPFRRAHPQRQLVAGRSARTDYCWGTPGAGGAGVGGRVRLRNCPQFRPIMQCEPTAWGWTGSQHWSSGAEGAGSTVGEGSAYVRGAPAPPGPTAPTTPPNASAATPPHTAAIDLAVRFAMKPIVDLAALDVHSRTRQCAGGGPVPRGRRGNNAARAVVHTECNTWALPADP